MPRLLEKIGQGKCARPIVGPKEGQHCSPWNGVDIWRMPVGIVAALVGQWQALIPGPHWGFTVLVGNADVRLAIGSPKGQAMVDTSVRAKRGTSIVKKPNPCDPCCTPWGQPISVRVGTLSGGTGVAASGGDVVLAVYREPCLTIVEPHLDLDTPVDASADVGAGSAVVMAANASRAYAFFQNLSATLNVHLATSEDATDPTATLTTFGPRLAPGDAYEMSEKTGNLILGDVAAIGSAAGPSRLLAWSCQERLDLR